MTRNRVLAAAGAITLVPALALVVPPVAAGAAPAGATAAVSPGEATTGLTTDKVALDSSLTTRRGARSAGAAAPTPAVGTVRSWIAMDDERETVYRKDYTLRGAGDKIEVWVANDLAFPAGDCRNAVPSSVQVTDAQVKSLITEFDTNIFPKETAAFSTPPDRDGTKAQINGDFTGDGDKTVTLVDNVHDANYYTFPASGTYIAGFVSVQFNNLLDRNVMTIDAFDWLHRTGAAPADEPTADPCTSRPARPRLYEGVFAHEWQHLLLSYVDPDEAGWLNEGLSDYAQTLVGYIDGTRTVAQTGFDNHLACFQGFGSVPTRYNPNPRDCGGPENSLNLWGESTNPSAILADYGNAYQFMLYLKDRFGPGFLSRLHRDATLQGLDSIAALIKPRGEKDLYTFLHDYQTMTLTDKIAGDSRRGVTIGIARNRATAASLRSTVNVANPNAFRTPGAAPNGADYVPLGPGAKLRTVKFRGDRTLPPQPLRWTVVTNDPNRAGNPVLFSGNGNSTDASAVTPVTVPAGSPALTFLAKYGAEEGYDYGYVVVSTDGGRTYTAIPGNKTVTGPRGPAINGATVGFEPHRYDLSAYAGRSILLGFQYISDANTNNGGWLIDDIAVGGTLLSDGSGLAPFDSITEIVPTRVAAWNVRLVGLDARRQIVLQRDLGSTGSFTATPAQLLDLKRFPQVVAIVAYDEPTETVKQYAPYTLKVNGLTKAGGR
ncbi:peptidase M6 immune inhibitor A [Actinoplanes sp. NPDC051494]|uniref:peptidase M6 immune inhibitor A n=1 Tax=Actinoplanes sp. NPDC051494 TaxID=3363907 RepID=UPI0037B0B498